METLAFHEKMEYVRHSAGMTQATAARLIAVSLRTYRNYESGRTTPNALAQKAIIQTLSEYLTLP